MPRRATAGSVGYDLATCEDRTVEAFDTAIICTGLRVMLPLGTYSQIASRSSWANPGLNVQGGVVDPDYTGELRVILHNTSDEKVHLLCATSVVQLILERCVRPPVEVGRARKGQLPGVWHRQPEPVAVRETGGMGSTNI
ncbi:hypothetical protein BOX15_Mlig033085g1 [Macrostomum lignano]|uniref:Deoxyuridine 5'-triphosphate nucleotidohydrolase n=1 Tax=Macrostomum lignano TaxID=282301 RepID=A0A267EBE7_9PLAT|nr:hypothetical protein BOX15_Mlig033085g1 [Macrostomum lignano]